MSGRGRGGRRGQFSSTNLSGLRDTVRRRLFDPNAAPEEPTIPSLLSRLKPISFEPIKLTTSIKMPNSESHLKIDKTQSPTIKQEKQKPKVFLGSPEFLSSVFRTECLIRYIFRCGPDFHKFVSHEEGISLSRLTETQSKTDSQKEDEALHNFSFLHLILDHENIEKWKSNNIFVHRYNPARWYPKDLVQMVKHATGKTAKRPNKRAKRSASHVTKIIKQEDEVDLDNAESAMEQAEMELELKHSQNDEDDDDDVNVSTKRRSKAQLESDEEDDPEDARWNGRRVKKDAADGMISEVEDEEEEDNDYCQDYFDNGEGDDAFDNIRMDDGEGDVEDYYD